MVMSYLVTSNAEYHQRVNEIENKIDKMIDKLEILEYNISVISTSLNKELDNISDIVRSLK
jgi:CHASE3 domain sensor protein|tara:strand:+ start:685 stop:867 length:183 start_codon:yes stop_codon:yes gene_type:complete